MNRAAARKLWALGVAAVLAFGASKLMAQLFLIAWQVASAGQSDIAARGVWLLAAFLPGIALTASVGTVLMIGWCVRRNQDRRVLVGFAVIGALVGNSIVFLGWDPIAYVLHLILWPTDLSYSLVSATSAAALIAAGVVGTNRVLSIGRGI